MRLPDGHRFWNAKAKYQLIFNVIFIPNEDCLWARFSCFGGGGGGGAVWLVVFFGGFPGGGGGGMSWIWIYNDRI